MRGILVVLFSVVLTGCGDITVNQPARKVIIEDNRPAPVVIEKTVEKPVIIEKTTVVEKPVIVEKRTIVEKPIIVIEKH